MIIIMSSQKDCNVVKISGICYDKEFLSANLASYSLAVDYDSNTLYFSHSENEEPRRVAKLDINTKEYETIEGTGNSFAQTVDQKTHNVYLGGDQGVYRYDPNTNKAELLGRNDTNIWSLFFKDTLYYTVFPSEHVYTITDGESTRFTDMEDFKADTFIIDNEDDMFYTNSIGLYSQRKGTKDAVIYKTLVGEVARGMAVDVSGNVYVCLDDGVYAVKKGN